MKTLVLNADYVPHGIVDWKKAMTMMYGDNEPAYCIEYYNKSIRDSMGRQYKLPSVVVLKNYVNIDMNKSAFSKLNVYYRDKLICQYCGCKCVKNEITIDHVIPKSRWKAHGKSGTSNTFENTVTCCQRCNFKKRNRTPQEAGMALLCQPKKITRRQVFINRVSMLDIPETWRQYLESVHERSPEKV